jgi:colicin import membrane protein
VSEEPGKMSAQELGAQIEAAERKLVAAADVAAAAERRATAEIEALEANLEEERTHSAKALEGLRSRHQEELQRERDAKAEAIAAAEERLAEIETQAELAEKRVEEAERRAEEAAGSTSESAAEAREAAAAWLRGQVEAIRREAEQQ